MMNKHSISTPTDQTKRLEQKLIEVQEMFPAVRGRGIKVQN